MLQESNTDGSTNGVEESFIKIPKDFKSLHDLGDLLKEHELLSRLFEALQGYQDAYVQQHLMSFEKALKYIPKSKLEKFNLRVRNYQGDHYSKTTFQERCDALFNEMNHFHDGGKYEKISDENRNQFREFIKEKAICLVDTKNNYIDLCGWTLDSVKIKVHMHTGKWYDKPKYVEKTVSPFVSAGRRDVLLYNGIRKYDIDREKGTLTFLVSYEYLAYQSVGGVWINGRERGYLSGESSIPYTETGYDKYLFCTKTNQYLGYGGCIEPPIREWVDD